MVSFTPLFSRSFVEFSQTSFVIRIIIAVMRVRTQQKSKDGSANKSSSLKSRSQQVFERLKSIYGMRMATEPCQPLAIGSKASKIVQSPRKLTPSKLKLLIPEKSRTPQQKSPALGFLTQRIKQKEEHNLASVRQNQAILEDLRRKMGARTNNKSNQTQKYFRKDREKPKVVGELNQTLRMVWEIKSKKPKYQFKMIRKMGKSQAGEILLALSNMSGIVLAMKTFRKQDIKLDFFIDESKIHFFCQHPNILPAYGLHVGREEAYLMMEVGEGNLYDRIVKDAPLDEHTVALYVAQVASAVSYLHQAGVMHRDIKPENIICFGNTLKLADFGWSIFTANPRKTLCGTMDYISPEVVNRQYYSNKIDCWSIGVLMYQMLTGQAPFPEQQKNPQFDGLSIPKALSSQGRNLLQKLLEKNPVDRIAAKDIQDHQWIKFHLRKQMQQQKRLYKKLRMELDIIFSL